MYPKTVKDLACDIKGGAKYTYKHGANDIPVVLDSQEVPRAVVRGSSPILYESHNSFAIEESDLIRVSKVA